MDGAEYKAFQLKKMLEFPVIKTTTKELAELFDVTERTIQNYVNERPEGMPRIEAGIFDLAKCLIWYIGKLKSEIKEKEFGGDKKSKFDLEEQKIKLEMRRIALNKMQGKVVDLELVRFAWIRQVKIFINNVDALAPRLNNILGGDRKSYDLIKQEIKQTRETIARDTELDFNKTELDIEQPKEPNVEN